MSPMRLRDASQRRLPGRYADNDDGPTRADRPTFVHQDVPYNAALAPHCAFPSLPLNHDGPGPSEVFRNQQATGNEAVEEENEDDSDDMDVDGDENKEEDATTANNDHNQAHGGHSNEDTGPRAWIASFLPTAMPNHATRETPPMAPEELIAFLTANRSTDTAPDYSGMPSYGMDPVIYWNSDNDDSGSNANQDPRPVTAHGPHHSNQSLWNPDLIDPRLTQMPEASFGGTLNNAHGHIQALEGAVNLGWFHQGGFNDQQGMNPSNNIQGMQFSQQHDVNVFNAHIAQNDQNQQNAQDDDIFGFEIPASTAENTAQSQEDVDAIDLGLEHLDQLYETMIESNNEANRLDLLLQPVPYLGQPLPYLDMEDPFVDHDSELPGPGDDQFYFEVEFPNENLIPPTDEELRAILDDAQRQAQQAQQQTAQNDEQMGEDDQGGEFTLDFLLELDRVLGPPTTGNQDPEQQQGNDHQGQHGNIQNQAPFGGPLFDSGIGNGNQQQQYQQQYQQQQQPGTFPNPFAGNFDPAAPGPAGGFGGPDAGPASFGSGFAPLGTGYDANPRDRPPLGSLLPALGPAGMSDAAFQLATVVGQTAWVPPSPRRVLAAAGVPPRPAMGHITPADVMAEPFLRGFDPVAPLPALASATGEGAQPLFAVPAPPAPPVPARPSPVAPAVALVVPSAAAPCRRSPSPSPPPREDKDDDEYVERKPRRKAATKKTGRAPKAPPKPRARAGRKKKGEPASAGLPVPALVSRKVAGGAVAAAGVAVAVGGGGGVVGLLGGGAVGGGSVVVVGGAAAAGGGAAGGGGVSGAGGGGASGRRVVLRRRAPPTGGKPSGEALLRDRRVFPGDSEEEAEEEEDEE
ncbi:hypothetical protein OQA88_13003 [Cercophora sp. LCS_1]